MQANVLNGWREVLARVFAGFAVEYGTTPAWLVNPETNRRLKLDYFFPEIALGVRFVGLDGAGRRRPKSEEELAAEAQREEARAAACRKHGVVLVSIDPDGEPRATLRGLEMALARASAHLAQGPAPQAQKQALMPRLSQARQRVGELTGRLRSSQDLQQFAEMWWERQASLAAPAPATSGVPKRSYRVGMRVDHARYGPGQVTAVEPEGGDVKVTVEFAAAGVRTFYASLLDEARLRVLAG